jgi:hypothetical protein
MFTRKSGILALVIGALVLGACEDDETTTPPLNPTITISPQTVPAITVGAANAFTLVASTTNLPAGATIQWSSSNQAIATVSNTGVVTCVAPGNATITAAISTDPTNLRNAVAVTCQAAGGGTTVGQPSITIGSVTQGGTNIPVNPGNVAGIIDVTLNVDIPTGVAASRVEIDIVDAATGNTVVLDNACSQAFATGGTAGSFDLAAAVPQTIVCSVNTAQLTPAGLAAILNGTYRLRAQVESGAQPGTALATATSQTYVFNNTDMLNAFVRTSRGPALGADGRSWRGGNVTVAVIPAIYSGARNSANDVASLTVSLTSSGPVGAYFATCDEDANAATPNATVPTTGAGYVGCPSRTVTRTVTTRTGDSLVVTFPETSEFSAAANGVGGIENPSVTVAINGTTVGGNAFVGGQQAFFQGTTPVAVTGANPLRLDNLAPRVTEFDITPASLGCTQAACYINSSFLFTDAYNIATGNDFYHDVDYGVDSETQTFAFAPTGTTTFTNAAGGATPAESQVAGAYILRVTSADALGNDTIQFAGTVATTPLNTATGAQTFGVDRTAPRVTAFTGVANNGTDQDDVDNVVTISFVDTAVAPAGPSGFGDAPLTVRMVRFNDANVDGALDSTVIAVTPVCGGTSCTFTIPDAVSAATAGYFRIVSSVRDVASGATPNRSADTTFIYLDDETAPTVAGVTAPSTISGAASVTFSADMSDNVELGDILASIGYTGNCAAQQNNTNAPGGSTCYYAHQPNRDLATYGLPLTSRATAGAEGSFTFNPFIYSLETTLAGGAPAGNAAFASNVNLAVRDEAGVQVGIACPAPGVDGAVAGATGPAGGSCVARENNNISVNVAAGSTLTNFAALNTGLTDFDQLAPTRSATTAGADPIILTAEALGPQGTFANPFTSVNFYRWSATQSRWILVGTATGVRAFDRDVQNVRVWEYTLSTTDAIVPTGTIIRAIGVRDGRGLIANPDVTVP